MSSQGNQEEFYRKLKVQLADTSLWPAPYLYKFIIPSNESKINQIEAIFDHSGAVINKKESRTGKYTSVSINVIMKNPDAVIEKYKKAGEVEGVISL